MKLSFYLFFLLYTLLFLFYPGNTYYYNLFAYNRDLFKEAFKPDLPKINQVPIIKFQVPPPVSAEGIYIVDIPSFTPVYQRNANYRFLPASITKIITALVTYDVFKPEDVITVKKIVEEGQIMGLVPGERITVENLLYGILIHSGNDAAYAVAESYGYDNFIKLMNEKVKNLGMKNSHFKNPAGLDDFDQYTSPFDMAIASRALLENPLLKKVVAIKEITIADVDFKNFHHLSNVNKLLGEIQGIGGLKTGFTENAGENLISFYKGDKHQFIIVLLRSQDRFKDTQEVITWINSNVDYLNVN